ncbi:MAG: calcium/sodium antiporter [Caldilineae bacterium]|nr:calcium/sodium antiporter [Caldilineae bacterium]
MEPFVLVRFVLGLLMLLVGAEALVRGASRLAAAAGVSALVIGLTVVAFGTSAPELAVSVGAVLSGGGGADVAVGNVVGSSIFNVLAILGLSAVITPLIIDQQLVRVDVPLMILASVLLFLMSRDGVIGRSEGLILFVGILAYTGFAIRNGRREGLAVAAEYEAAFGQPARGWRSMAVNLGLLVLGLALLLLGSRWLVEGAVSVARHFGISELVIGLTIVAAGTSLPELATSAMASLRGERDIAAGNVIGSNLFNILCVLGATATVAPGGLAVSPAAVSFDIPVMLAAAVACLPIFFVGNRISRWNGWLFLGYYGAYVGFLLLRAAQHDALPRFSQIMLAFVLPLTVIAILLPVWRELSLRRREGGGEPA